MRKINLSQLTSLPSFSQNVSEFYKEAAICALTICGHKKGVQVKIFGVLEEKIELFWTDDIGEGVAKGWKDEAELVEYGATGIALLLLLNLTDYTIFERSPKGTRADFWVGKINEDGEEELTGLLEISGMKKETPNNRINARLNKRIKRMEESPFRTIPFYVFIIEFTAPKVKYHKNER